jgi:cytochrome c-type biogenesis protein CcmE
VTDTAAPGTPPLAVPPRKRNRVRYVIVGVLCLAAIGWMLVLMTKNVVFFKTVSQAVHDESHDGVRTLRIGGGVVPASIKQRADGADFELAEGGVTVHIHHSGDEPELFKACAPVVAEGHWDAPGSTTFDSTRLLIKHGADYKPPKTATQCPPKPFGDN